MHTDLSAGLDFLQTWQVIATWLVKHEALLIFCAILFEESGIPMPLPADLAMALAGHRVAQGHMSLLQAFLIGQSATLIGSSILYWVGRRGGRPLLFRYGKVLRISAHRIAQVERLIIRLGPLAVIIGRQIPGLRLASPLACGVFRIPYRLFLPAMVVGSTVYIAAFIALGMYGGTAMVAALRLRELPIGLLVSTLFLAVSGFLLWRISRQVRDVAPPAYRAPESRRSLAEAALLAGLGSSALTGLVLTWLLDVIGLLGRSSPEQMLAGLLERSVALPIATAGLTPTRLVFASLIATIPFQVAIFLVWAVLYAFVFERHLWGSAALRGLQFAVLPWLFSMLVVYPVLGAGAFGMRLGTAVVPAVGELIRYAVFGVGLGALYRLIHLARQPRPHKGHRHGHRNRPDQPGALQPPQRLSVPGPAPALKISAVEERLR